MDILQSSPSEKAIQFDEHEHEESDQAVEEHLFVSEESYWAEYYHGSDTIYEWNNGYLEERPT